MRLLADEDIPYVQNYFSECKEIILKPGRHIQRADLIHTDILLVRSVTPVNKALLEGTAVKFVGTATTGIDHLDIDWLNKAGIAWAAAKGCNQKAVVEYVLCVIAALQKQGKLKNKNPRAGVVGVGSIGSRVAENLKKIGFDVVLYDPPRALVEKDFHSCEWKELSECDFITLHVPLITAGPFPTHHLIDAAFLQSQKKDAVLLNTSRGAVIDFDALKKYGTHLIECLDVWEHEPVIDIRVLQNTMIATPHIAGYSFESKLRGTEMLYQAAFQKKMLKGSVKNIAYPAANFICITSSDWKEQVLKIYDPLVTSKEMKKALMQDPGCFDRLRKEFPLRREFLRDN